MSTGDRIMGAYPLKQNETFFHYRYQNSWFNYISSSKVEIFSDVPKALYKMNVTYMTSNSLTSALTLSDANLGTIFYEEINNQSGYVSKNTAYEVVVQGSVFMWANQISCIYKPIVTLIKIGEAT